MSNSLSLVQKNINSKQINENQEIIDNRIEMADKGTFLKSNLSMFFKLFNGIKINNTIKVVGHSGLMKNYFKIKNGNTEQIKELEDTNVWSFKEKIESNIFIVSRHAFTLANMFKEKGKVLNQISESDTSLSCYGILSTLLKAEKIPILNKNAKVISNTTNQSQKIPVANNKSPIITIINKFDKLNSNLSPKALLLKFYLMEIIGERINYRMFSPKEPDMSYGIVFYKKKTNNAKKNFSRLWKNPSGYVKILKISSSFNINKICNELAENMTESITGSCIGSKIRLRLKDNKEYCIPDTHEYIFKSDDNNLQIGDIVQIQGWSYNNKYTSFTFFEKFKNKNLDLDSEKIYVSVLIRTWMTAICLYLPSCKKNKLILEVSPYLKEEGSGYDNTPLAFQKQKEQIIKFIKFLYNLHIKDTGKYKKISQTLDNFRNFFDSKKLIINQNYYGKSIKIDINILQLKQKINDTDLTNISSDYILYNLDMALENEDNNNNNNYRKTLLSKNNGNINNEIPNSNTIDKRTNGILFYPGIRKPSKEDLNKLSRWCEPFSRKDLFIKNTCKFTPIMKNNKKNTNPLLSEKNSNKNINPLLEKNPNENINPLLEKNPNENNNSNRNRNSISSTNSMNSLITAKSRNSKINNNRETIYARHNGLKK